MNLPTERDLCEIVSRYESLEGKPPASLVANPDMILALVHRHSISDYSDVRGVMGVRVMGIPLLPEPEAPLGHVYARDYIA